MATKFRYPTGARPLLIEETARRRRIESRFVSILESAGFSEIVLPIIDYAEPYAPILERGSVRQSYRFVDREGELVGIRSDFTPMVARALAPSMSPGELLRVFYRGDVIRCEASRLGANRELFQIGAEIVGDPSPAADIAVMRLAADILRAFDAKPLVVYNDTSLVAQFDESTRTALTTKRMRDGLPPLAQKLIAGTATIDDVRAFDAQSAERLDAIARELDPDEFQLHLDDIDENNGYYTGLRFRLFSAGSRTKLAQGGRYDTLYERFGTPAAAVGFTFTIDELLERRPRAGWPEDVSSSRRRDAA
ncbi:MAG TPA: ATP phosphoribosyltransferase regulatory subunit, partial [Thermoanaerobaculia bacterium]|nr:ATP phosphoribosyltransferase regulatory subunit [Thermoanaerobaculia bacterium]